MTDLPSGRYPDQYEEWLLDGSPAQAFRSNFSRRATLLAAGITMTADSIFVVPVVLQTGDLIKSVTVGVKTATAATASHGWAALYTGLATGSALITGSQSADNTSGFTSSGSAQTFTLGTAYQATSTQVVGVALYNNSSGSGGILDALGQSSEAVAGGVYVTGQVPLLFTKASTGAGATAPSTLSGFAAATAGTNMAALPLVILH